MDAWLIGSLSIRTISVNGVPKPFHDVTDEDFDLMTPDEYEAYWAVANA